MGQHRILLALGAIAFAAGTARADVASEAQFFDALGRSAYERGQFEKALDAFQLVHEIAPSQGVLYNIALCADLAGRREMAFSLYQEYLKGDDPDGQRRSEAQARTERLKAKLALVTIESEPSSAAIYVDRKELGQFGVTPATIAVPDGEHRLLIERPGFAPESVSVVAKSGALATLRVSLSPLYGRLTVRVTPKTAELRILRDDAPAPVHREQGRYRLPAGPYRIVAKANGYAPAESPVLVRENADAVLDLALVRLPQTTGRLLVSTGKIAAEVFVDGKRMAVTPATLTELAVGEHTLEVRAGRHVSRRRIAIVKGRATYVAIDLAAPRR
jgi:tetratricopeptide (TPR) repeat protein